MKPGAEIIRPIFKPQKSEAKFPQREFSFSRYEQSMKDIEFIIELIEYYNSRMYNPFRQ